MFSSTITQFWDEQLSGTTVLVDTPQLHLAIRPALPSNRRLVLLSDEQGLCRAVIEPALAEALGESLRQCHDEAGLRALLRSQELELHGADQLFYWPESVAAELQSEPTLAGIRQLDEGDEPAFAEFQAQASEDDLDAAFVELDHWAVFGAFDAAGRLLCAASAYAWDEAPLADLGVLSRPEARRRGLACQVLRALAGHALSHGLQPQYRSQLDNKASLALAHAAGLQAFARWDVLTPDDEDDEAFDDDER